MKIWLRQHLDALQSAMHQINSARSHFLFNVLVIAVALSLPFAGLTLIDNLRPISAELSIEPELSLFLKTDVSRADALLLNERIKKLIQANKTPANVTFMPKEKALSSLQNKTDLGDVLSTLGQNPLPDAFIVSFEQHLDVGTQPISPAKIEQLAKQFKQMNEVDHIQIDSNWIKRLSALLRLAQLALLLLAAMLAVVVVTVIFNATRLQVLSRRAEIAVITLLGATKQFIRRPYYYTGAILGLTAGLFALGIVAIILQPLNGAISQFANLYGSTFQLTPLNALNSLYLVATSILLGLFGAFLSVRHQAR